jgi:hypothetical protein
LWRRRTLDAQQLRDHLSEVTEYVERARTDFLHNNPLTVPHEDDPFVKPPPPGAKPPGNLSAQALADMEVCFVGNLIDYCIAAGSVPPVRMGCFWRDCEGGILGLRSSGIVEDEHGERYPDLERVISHLRAYAGEVVTTEGVGDLLRAGEATRDCLRFYYDKPDKNYRTIVEVATLTGRGKSTIYRWVDQQWVDCIQDIYGDVVIDLNSALAVRDILDAKRKNPKSFPAP